MSMHYYSCNGYGMYLNENEYDKFKEKYAALHNLGHDDVDVEDAFYYDDSFNAGFAMLNDDLFDGRGICHLETGHEKDDDDFADGFFMFSDRQGSIFASNSYYSDITEMAGEYKRKFGTYLPDDFDYEAHLAFFSGAQYC